MAILYVNGKKAVKEETRLHRPVVFPIFSISSARSCFRSSLPTFVFGKSARNSISVGSLYLASSFLHRRH